ncbi:MAG: penicillin-binding transpeptidase domain-containing protein [Ornithinimicrobium sp.]|uniref:peptidoglycan D,D-transpeptidase FtsI family protein n=1 Tax=Ornithinimicrobium sp. TaxID=1977084 RepID=UPI0026E06D3F|nr:penicillin-binding transpeptidase domain-containing protein [Ornithinimicrobium sp.]MDO5741231.1 penicillin-binding transpeptidase domain-containing protein [Ornithinimicrobium sp.]
MNTPIRRLAIVVLAMFTALLMATTWIQFVQAQDLRELPGNRRTLIDSYSRERGAILVDGTAIARSEATDDELEWVRRYDQANRYAHITGYYSFTYGAGLGLERARNAVLAGTDDSLFYQRLSDVVTGQQPQGASLELTIDPSVQAAAAEALGDRRGAAVALDPKTGAILAMVSHPSFDPNAISSHQLVAVDEAYAALIADPDKPLVNRALAGDLYPPGSTFKLVVAAAALESGKYTAESELEGPRTYTLPGTQTDLPNFGGAACDPLDKPTLAESVQVSCNTSFAWLAGELGPDAIREQADKFGFGQALQVPMSVTPSSYPDELNDAQVALTGIGQYDVRVTPLQVAMISAAIANDGVVMSPYLVDTVRNRDLEVIEKTNQRALSRAVSSRHAATLRDMMVSVVERGSGTAAQIPGMAVAGKTGTAEFGTEGAAHAWFTAFAPADDPQIAVAVIVESATDNWAGATGGTVAAPIARAMLEAGVQR